MYVWKIYENSIPLFTSQLKILTRKLGICSLLFGKESNKCIIEKFTPAVPLRSISLAG